MKDTKGVGERSEAIILAHLLKKGFVVLLPFGNNQPYDMVIDHEDQMIRVQCKTGRRQGGSLVFNTCSQSSVSYKRRSYAGRADIFLVYFPETEKIYRVPVIGTPAGSSCTLRIDPVKTDPKRVFRWAKDFEY